MPYDHSNAAAKQQVFVLKCAALAIEPRTEARTGLGSPNASSPKKMEESPDDDARAQAP